MASVHMQASTHIYRCIYKRMRDAMLRMLQDGAVRAFHCRLYPVYQHIGVCDCGCRYKISCSDYVLCRCAALCQSPCVLMSLLYL